MKVGQVLTQLPGVEAPKSKSLQKSLKETSSNFGSSLDQAIKDVNSLQKEASQAVQKMVSGESGDLHEVMIAVEKAKTSFDLLMEIRNKTLDVYREIMRMQV